VLVGDDCAVEQVQWLRDCGVEVVTVATARPGRLDFAAVLAVLAEKGVMHVLVEGGRSVLGTAFDRRFVDHVAVFIAPKIIGGNAAPSPVGEMGLAAMADAFQLQQARVERLGQDILVEGTVRQQ
jgi:diaminohydroxyphosphoribosylaminopyrimidine deaminase/5-amino-6-(5-phosphoribosylamino)uracil reductase